MDWLNELAHWVGYAVCHQLPAHSYITVQGPMPLCARCTGQYLGILVTLGYTWVRGRWRYAGWPILYAPIGWGIFVLLWLVDGLNSFLAFIGVGHLYMPHNSVRLITGYLMGVVIGAHMWALFATALGFQDEPTLRVPEDVRRLLLLGLIPLGGVWLGGWVRWVLGMISALGVIVSLALLLSVPGAARLRKKGGGPLWPVIVKGALFAVGLIIGMDLVRYYLS